jgi:hypothetical protein
MLETDIWRAAQLMIETHGDEAERQAALEADCHGRHRSAPCGAGRNRVELGQRGGCLVKAFDGCLQSSKVSVLRTQCV